MNRLKLELQPDGLLLLAMLYFVGDGGTLLALAAAVAVHEWGHGAALRLCGCRVSRIRVDITGLCMDYSRAVHGRNFAVPAPDRRRASLWH